MLWGKCAPSSGNKCRLVNYLDTFLAVSAGECNQALAQQALVLREHMAQRDAETASLASELQRARVRHIWLLCIFAGRWRMIGLLRARARLGSAAADSLQA